MKKKEIDTTDLPNFPNKPRLKYWLTNDATHGIAAIPTNTRRVFNEKCPTLSPENGIMTLQGTPPASELPHL